MVKILFVVPVGQDMGGIITSTEQYVLGLREAGCEVTPICAVFTKRDEEYGSMPRGKFADDYRTGDGTGWLLHPTAGWRNERRVSLACEEGVERFIKLAKQHDIVVWASVYGFRNEATEGQTYWVRAIRAGKGKNMFFIHDDHMPERYPWGFALAKYAAAFVGVQPCSYDSLEGIACPRAMIYTPLPKPPARVAPMAQRHGYLSCQVWKTWKRADAMVAAAAHMPKSLVEFAGDGIQLRYMRSPDKCPPRYAGLWDAAMKKQTYLGVLSEAARDDLLGYTKFLVDLSYRENSGQYNRIVQEAMAQGCVVIANPRFITGTRSDPLFVPEEHYLPISEKLYDDPKALAQRLLGLERDFAHRYATIQKNARAVLHNFDRKVLGQRIVDVFNNADSTAIPRVNPAHIAAFEAVFGGKP